MNERQSLFLTVLYCEKSKAIFRLRKAKVTHAAKKFSDISAPEGQGHLCCEKSEAIYRLQKTKVTYAAKKVKRYISSRRPRSPMLRKSKAIFQILKAGLTCLEVRLFYLFSSWNKYLPGIHYLLIILYLPEIPIRSDRSDN